MNSRECPMCQDRKGQRWTEALFKGTKTIREAQQAFGMSKEQIEEHLYKHSPDWSAQQTAVMETQDREFYIKRLSQMGNDLHEMLEDVIDFGSTNPETIKSATTLTREIRETLRLLGEITKVISDDESARLERALLDMRSNYLTLTNLITTRCCPDCKAKILADIETQKKLIGK